MSTTYAELLAPQEQHPVSMGQILGIAPLTGDRGTFGNLGTLGEAALMEPVNIPDDPSSISLLWPDSMTAAAPPHVEDTGPALLGRPNTFGDLADPLMGAVHALMARVLRTQNDQRDLARTVSVISIYKDFRFDASVRQDSQAANDNRIPQPSMPPVARQAASTDRVDVAGGNSGPRHLRSDNAPLFPEHTTTPNGGRHRLPGQDDGVIILDLYPIR